MMFKKNDKVLIDDGGEYQGRQAKIKTVSQHNQDPSLDKATVKVRGAGSTTVYLTDLVPLT
jgi:hypothetical protein